MHFVGANWGAIVIAAIAGFVIGAVWYRIFSKKWTAAAGVPGDMRPAVMPFIVGFAANVVVAIGIAGLLGHFGPGDQVTVRHGVIVGMGSWLGFTITTTAANYTFARRPLALLAIDGGYWLVAMAVMGWIIGAMGVK
jgi:hypothetical protein